MSANSADSTYPNPLKSLIWNAWNEKSKQYYEVLESILFFAILINIIMWIVKSLTLFGIFMKY